MKGYVLSAQARLDLLRIWNYLCETAGIRVAQKVVRDLRAGMRKLAETPGIGHVREDLSHEPLRFWRVYSYLIVYRPDARPLQIVHVVHGRDGRAGDPDDAVITPSQNPSPAGRPPPARSRSADAGRAGNSVRATS